MFLHGESWARGSELSAGDLELCFVAVTGGIPMPELVLVLAGACIYVLIWPNLWSLHWMRSRRHCTRDYSWRSGNQCPHGEAMFSRHLRKLNTGRRSSAVTTLLLFPSWLNVNIAACVNQGPTKINTDKLMGTQCAWIKQEKQISFTLACDLNTDLTSRQAQTNMLWWPMPT